MSERPEHRLKRLKMRSMRRGIREMDMILSAFAESRLPDMAARDLDLYDALLQENDQDLYQWVTGRAAPPDPYRGMISEISQVFQK